MKLFSKILAIFLIALFAVNVASAQKKTKKAVGGEPEMFVEGDLGILFPMGDFGDFANTGFGLFGTFNNKIDQNLYVTGSLGYTSFGGPEVGYVKITSTIIPILGGIRYNFDKMSNGITPYVGAEAGLYVFSSSAKYSTGGYSQTVTSSETDFGIAIKGGIKYPLDEGMALDVNLRFDNAFASGSNVSFFALRAGVAFNLD